MRPTLSPHPARALFTSVALGCVALALACSGEGPEKVAEPSAPADFRTYTIDEFLDSTAYTGGSFSPDNSKVLVSSDATGIFNAYAVPVDGGEPEALTVSAEEAVLVVGYFPGDERFLYLSDQGGDELDHLFVRELDGSVVDLTPGEGLKAIFLGWSGDDGSLFLGTNERDQRYFDIYEVAVDGYERTMIHQDDEGLQVGAISPDGRYIAFARPRTTADSDVLLLDREGGAMTNLTEHEGDVANQPQAFDAESASLFYTSDEGGEFAYLVRYDLGSGERVIVDQPEWDVVYAYPSRRGRYLVVAVNRDASTDLHLYETATMERVELPALPAGDISTVRISMDESHLSFYLSDSRTPRDLFVHDLGSGEAPRRLTRSLTEAIDPSHLAMGEVVRFSSYDGVEIPGILYQPVTATPDDPAPALVWVHGGPGGQSRLGYNASLQYLVNHGYAVYAINNRGSSGYGKTFFKMDDQRHGEADLGDCVAAKGMLAATGWVDPERIGILGGSYGGYMVLAALTLRPEEFAVGVDLFGISNWIRTLESIPPWWESFREALYQEMGNPEEDQERLRRISPLFNAGEIVRPLMVLQGANDPRVLQVESDDIVEAARANGVPVEYVVFDDEGHGFLKKENRAEGYRKIREFLDQHLAGRAVGTAEAREAA